MTLVTCNLCAGLVTGERRIGSSFGLPGARHAGKVETLPQALWKIALKGRKKGRHAKLAGRHAKPPRAFF